MKDIRQYEAINPCVVAKDLEDLGIYTCSSTPRDLDKVTFGWPLHHYDVR